MRLGLSQFERSSEGDEVTGSEIASIILGSFGFAFGGAGGALSRVSYRRTKTMEAKIDLEFANARVRFQGLHERRLEILAELYRRIIQVEGALKTWMHGPKLASQTPLPREKEAKAVRDYKDYFEENRIWFDEALSEGLEELWFLVQGLAGDLASLESGEISKEMIEKLDMTYFLVDKILPFARGQIEQSFRQLLGVVSDGRS